MGTTEVFVIALSLTALAWVNWYFFMGERKAAVALRSGGVSEVTVKVLGGYDPAVIRVAAGDQVRLVFDRQETSSCSEEVVIPEFGVRRFLPAFEKTAIELTAGRPGSYEFTCGMGMLKGRLVVEEATSHDQ